MTKEERGEEILRIAHNRWEVRQKFNWRMDETAEDDYRYAERLVDKCLTIQNTAKTAKNK